MSEHVPFRLNSRLKKKILGFRIKPSVLVSIKDLSILYRVNNKSSVTVSPLYSFMDASFPLDEMSRFNVIHKGFGLSSGSILELSLKPLPRRKVEKIEGHDKWTGHARHQVYSSVPLVTAKEIIEFLSENGIVWKEVLDFLVDDTLDQSKSEEIKGVIRSVSLPLPFDDSRLWQQYNNHAVLLTGTGTAKTTTFERFTGVTASTSPTAPGLLGTLDGAGPNSVSRSGALNGSGPFMVDEFTKAQPDIISHLLNYMESGSVTRSISQKVACVGTKSLVFSGNPGVEINGKSFKEAMVHLGGSLEMGRTGRRIAHIIFGSFPSHRVSPFPLDTVLDARIRSLIRTIVEEKSTKIETILKKCLSWVNNNDSPLVNQHGDTVHAYEKYFAEKVAPFQPSKEMSQFALEHGRAWKRIKFGAIKWAILDNLDKVAGPLPVHQLVDDIIIPDAKHYFDLLKQYNIASMRNTLSDKKERAAVLFSQGIHGAIIATDLRVSENTVCDWRRQFVFSGSIVDRKTSLIPVIIEDALDGVNVSDTCSKLGIDRNKYNYLVLKVKELLKKDDFSHHDEQL